MPAAAFIPLPPLYHVWSRSGACGAIRYRREIPYSEKYPNLEVSEFRQAAKIETDEYAVHICGLACPNMRCKLNTVTRR